MAAAIFLVGLGRYPVVHPDEAFFSYPAWKAATGGSLIYAVSGKAPYANEFWAYHSPILPLVLEATYRLFGFSLLTSRLPNFLAGWAAILLLAVWLHKKTYYSAAFAFALLWTGDRAPLEIMCARMDGLGLFCLATGYISLDLAASSGSLIAAIVAGFLCGFAALVHPACILVPCFGFLVLALWRKWAAMSVYFLAALLNVALLLLVWHGRVAASIQQFQWHLHARDAYKEGAFHGFLRLLVLLRWSKFWVIALMLCILLFAGTLIRTFRSREASSKFKIALLLASGFGLATVQALFHSPTYPPYLVFFSVWPILGVSLLWEKYRHRYTAVFAALFLVWLTSAFWNTVRLREMVIHYNALNRAIVDDELRSFVPQSSDIMATPELYAIPIEAGFRHAEVTTWFPEQHDVCSRCFLLMQKAEYDNKTFVTPENLQRRQVLFSGPAFGEAKSMTTPIVILSPEQ